MLFRARKTLFVPQCEVGGQAVLGRQALKSNVGNSVPFNANVKLSLNRVIYAIVHHLEVNSIGFEHNSRVRVKNTLLVKKCSSRSEKHFAGIKTGKVDNSVHFNANV